MLPVPCHITNGDEERYGVTLINSFTKGLPHDNLGIVLPAAWQALLKALTSKLDSDFEAIPLGGTIKFKNPQSGLWKDLESADTASFNFPPAPRFNSARSVLRFVLPCWG